MVVLWQGSVAVVRWEEIKMARKMAGTKKLTPVLTTANE